MDQRRAHHLQRKSEESDEIQHAVGETELLGREAVADQGAKKIIPQPADKAEDRPNNAATP
jgi:hypothetical protein